MADYSVDELVQKAVTLGIMAPEQLQEVWSSFGTQNIEVEPFVQALLRQGHLTKYQVDRLTSGESTGFYYGEYKVLYPVGAGSFARVYRAVHPKSKKVVAVKVLRNRYCSDQTAVDLFIREAELGMSFRHPNIVPIYAVQSEKNVHYMVMDFIEGQTLREFVNIRKKVEPKVATRIITDICLGLDYAFKRGNLHRDLKMTNVLLSSSGKAVLVDFGLASSEKESEPDRKNQRAIDYAALERSTGVRRDDKRSDLFFLGTMFYHMLTGIPPLSESRDRAKRLDKTRFLSIKPISEIDSSVPFAVSFIVDKAMNLDPEKRYQSPGAMLVDLEVAVKKLEEGTADENSLARQRRLASASSLSLASVAKKDNQIATVMIVEANPEMQNLFRQSLKKTGYRVLLLSSAERALERVEENDQPVDCVLFNAQSLGTRAVVAFNELGASKLTAETPAILLLDENQIKWAARARRDKHRVAVGMPITMKRLQEVLHKLISDRKKVQNGVVEGKEQVRITPSAIGIRGAASLSSPAIPLDKKQPEVEKNRGNGQENKSADDKEKEKKAVSNVSDEKKEGAVSLNARTSDVGIADDLPLEGSSQQTAIWELGSTTQGKSNEPIDESHPFFADKPASDINLGDAENDADYVAYLNEGNIGTTPAASGLFSTDLFDAALDDAVESLVEKVDALKRQADENSDGEGEDDSVIGSKNAPPATPSEGGPSGEESPLEIDDDYSSIDYADDDDL